MNEKPKHYDVKSLTVTFEGRTVTGVSSLLWSDPEDRRMEAASDALARLRAHAQEAVNPTPKNRHERRAAAAKARKGGW